MNDAERVLRQFFGFGGEAGVDAFAAAQAPAVDRIHPDIEFSLFGMSGRKEYGRGRPAYLAFVERCAAALADRTDEILSITGADEQIAIVRARAWRRSAATGEEIRYEWVMLFRVENGQITYGADMLDRDAQEFWGRIRGG